MLERLAGFEPACTALEERSLNPLGHRRMVTSKWPRNFERDPGMFNASPQSPNVKTPNVKIWSERLESNQRPRASEARALIQLSYAHKTLEQAAGIEPAFLR